MQLIATRKLKKFRLGYENFDDQEKSGRPKNLEKSVLQAIETNLVGSTLILSDMLRISQSKVVLIKIRNCQIVPHVTKILQFFFTDVRILHRI